MKENNRPEIHFKDFTEEWEKRKFKDFISRAGEKNLVDENYPAYSVSNKLGLVNQTEQFDNSRLDNLDKTSYKLVNPDEFVYNPARINVGSIAFNDLNETVIVSSLYVVLKMNEELDNEFIMQFIKSHSFIHEVRKNTEGSVRMYLFFNSFKNIKFPYTSNINEQIKIGKFFKEFDKTIAFHQQELDNLKQTKQGFMQKMFPEKGKFVPELRFPGFVLDWETCKLKDLGEIQTGSTPPTVDGDNYSEEGMIWVTPTDISSLVTTSTAKKLSEKGQIKARIVEPGTILVTSIASIGKNTMVRESASFNQQINSLTPSNDNNSYFLLTQSELWSKKMKNTAASGTMQIVNKKDFSNINVLIPKKEEQIKIGNFFKQLDETIDLHQQELEALQETKQGFLQKMFV